MFFGDDFYVELCRVILLQPGSLDLTSMFRNSSPCVGRQVNIPLDSGDLKYLSENKLSGDSDFDSFLNLFIQKNFNQTGFVFFSPESPTSLKQRSNDSVAELTAQRFFFVLNFTPKLSYAQLLKLLPCRGWFFKKYIGVKKCRKLFDRIFRIVIN